jgi:predicted PurR-regulated permease PerM
LIIRPFIIVLISAAVLAYIFYPVYKWFVKKIKSKNSSALIVSVVILLIIIIPASFLFYEVTKEAGVGYVKLQQYANSGFASCETGKICDFIKQPQVKIQIQNTIEKLTNYVSESANEFIFTIPRRLLDLLILFFSVFFFLRDGPEMLHGIRKLSVIDVKHENKIINQLKEVTRSVIYGVFVIAIIEGVIAAVTFYFAGLSSPILWGFVVAILAFIPFIGPTIVWVPAVIIQLLFQEPYSALIIVIGGIVLSGLDFFVKPRTIGKRANVHPIVIFIGLLGGIAFFGIIGIILGPLILALLISFLKMYKEEK